MKVTKNQVKQILKEEVERLTEASITRGFQKAIETYQTAQLKQQTMRKAFVSEKDVKKKEKLKQDLIRMHTVMQKAESEFQRVLRDEPVDLGEDIKFYKEHKTNKIKRLK